MDNKDIPDFVCTLCDGIITVYHPKSTLKYRAHGPCLKNYKESDITTCSFNPGCESVRVNFKNEHYDVLLVSYYECETKKQKLIDEFNNQWSIIKWATQSHHLMELERLEKERRETKATEIKQINDYVATLPKTEEQLHAEEVNRLRKAKYELTEKYRKLLRIKNQRDDITELQKQCAEMEEKIKTVM